MVKIGKRGKEAVNKTLIVLVMLVVSILILACTGKKSDTPNAPASATGEASLPSDSGGTLTITDIPSRFNGMYAVFEGEGRNTDLFGAQTYDAEEFSGTGALISNGSVSIPLYYMDTTTKYSGNKNGGFVELGIFENSKYDFNNEPERLLRVCFYNSVTFTNGNATKSYNDKDSLE